MRGHVQDCPVSELGHRQIAALGAYVKATAGPRVKIFASGFVRAMQTASGIAEALQVKIHVKPFLGEVFGPYGHKSDGSTQMFPGVSQSEAVSMFPWVDASELGECGWYDVEGGIETLDRAGARADAVVKWLHDAVADGTDGCEPLHSAYDDVFIVTHAYFLDFLMQRMFGVTDATQMVVVCHPNTAFSTFEMEPIHELPEDLQVLARSKVSGRCMVVVTALAVTPHLLAAQAASASAASSCDPSLSATSCSLITGGHAAGTRWWGNMSHP